ncbi:MULTISPECIES: ribose 5-phosphate isomerase B [Paenibacillus]|uniref:Ribose 5-phosphate isomerase B n=1 Tax=Paenibacillus lignilyticus TaxID=1172615 RepID=A0ABS5CDI7_9BACL|nr:MULTISPECIES: ribose 5-phosphate isomerase B [Paenibacillus]MBP3964011.1 ribose 5-phosphate isomerase B [Paenibacillus lignilyticus]SFS68894.1 ribose 5-phosphate isomerase B [Paenibacillus sp. BC26]
MKISLGCDHAGFHLKSAVAAHLAAIGCEVIDHGCYSADAVDFPDIARLVCHSVLKGEAERGIMVCGTGVGASIAANKIPGIRAAVCHDYHSAHQSVEHDDVNVMCVGAKIVGEWLVKDLISSYVSATFSTEEQFRRRVEKLAILEREAAIKLRE